VTQRLLCRDVGQLAQRVRAWQPGRWAPGRLSARWL
jgi:hypothetical protein